MKKHKKLLVLLVIVAAVIIACLSYLNTGYDADEEAIAAFSPSQAVLTWEVDGNLAYVPKEPEAGLVFYPGGKVDHLAYEPLMKALAAENILCVLVEMPFDLAVFNMDGADGVSLQFPDVDSWYLAGHSLGGAMAGSYLAENAGVFDGLILLGAYSTADLSAMDLEVLSLYGSEDFVLNKDKYEENLKNLPEGFTEVILEGGCHAGFGMYGPQSGDGSPTITAEEQIQKTAALIADFIY